MALVRILKRLLLWCLITSPVAWLLRAVRFGWRDAHRRLGNAYWAINPLEPRNAIRAVEADPDSIPVLATIPEVNLADVVHRTDPVRLSPLLSHRDGAMPQQDLLALLALVADRKPSVLFEIGTFDGATTAMLALNAPGATVHTLDLPPGHQSADSQLEQDDLHLVQKRRVGAEFRLAPGARFVQHLGDSASWDYAPVREADFVLIDGAHTYDYIRSDTEKCLANCRHPLTVVWHDCDLYHPGVIRWLAEMTASGQPVRRIRGTSVAFMTVQ